MYLILEQKVGTMHKANFKIFMSYNCPRPIQFRESSLTKDHRVH